MRFFRRSASKRTSNEDLDSFTSVHDHLVNVDDFEDGQSESSDDAASNNGDLPTEDLSGSDNELDDPDGDDVSDDNDSDYEGSGEKEISSHSKSPTDEIESDNGDEFQTSISDPKNITLQLMKKTRSLVSTIHHSSILDAHVREKMSSKQNDGTQQQSKGELVVDFRIRWNSTHLMIDRFIGFRQIVNEITHTTNSVIGLRSDQEKKLSRLAYSHFEWNWLIALEFVLQPLENAIRILSGRTYQTLSIKQLVMNGLKTFLTTYKTGEGMVNTLKKLLLVKYQEYCENSISKEEHVAMMVRKCAL